VNGAGPFQVKLFLVIAAMDKKDQPDRDKLANALTRVDETPEPAMAPKPDQHKMDKSDKMAMTQVDASQKPAAAPPRPAPIIGGPQPQSPVGGQFNVSAGPPATPSPQEPPQAPRFTVSDAPARTVWVGGGGSPAPADPPTVGTAAPAGPRPQAGPVFDPVVGWLVVISGPGKGSSRPVHNGNNAIGRSPRQRIPIDFGDDAISSEEQAYLRYDPTDRTFLLIPNLAKANLVAVNDKKPTSAVQLNAGDVISMGRTKLLFAPLCGPHFDWSDQDGKM
jgi:hypothetical protein